MSSFGVVVEWPGPIYHVEIDGETLVGAFATRESAERVAERLRLQEELDEAYAVEHRGWRFTRPETQ